MSRTARITAAVIFATLSIWLLSPALTSNHVEAFTARLQSMAILGNHGELALDDQTYPVNTEYLYGTRAGTVQAVGMLMRLTHSNGEVNFRILMLLSYAVFVISCLIFARRWNGSPYWAAFAFILLTPGLVEVSFFFSDNLPSAALATLALALIGRRTAVWTWLLIGALMAWASLMRTDGLFVAPSILLVAAMRDEYRWGRIAGDVCALVAGAVVVFWIGWRTSGISLLHALRIGSFVGHIHVVLHSPLLMARTVAFLFFGLVSIVLLLAGGISNWRTHTVRWNLVFTIYPILLYLFFSTRAFEMRDFLLLGAPFLVAQGATGILALLGAAVGANRTPKLLAWAAIAVFVLVSVMPPFVVLHDGPRTRFGRLWSPLLWRKWQAAIVTDMKQDDALIGSVRPGERLLVVSSLFQSDRYLHLRLLEQGYNLERYPEGSPFGEVYRKGDRTVIHVRTENPYGILHEPPHSLPFYYVERFQMAHGLDGIKPEDFDRAVLLTWGTREDFEGHVADFSLYNRPAGPMYTLLPGQSLPALHRDRFGRLRIIPMSASDLAELREFSLTKMHEQEAAGEFTPLRDYGVLHQALSCRFCTGPVGSVR